MSEQLTLRVHDRRAVQREIKRLQLEYDPMFRAQTYELHDAIVQVGLANPDLVLTQLQDRQSATHD
ncbi:hypothetical protein ACFQGT_17600 [Natrialbaceae archaeon GCM10025810]|uniref:hypothetical protein n=1 Tax=Halovalidus salilacus TaxID=3075124 RepID=UPI00360727A3